MHGGKHQAGGGSSFVHQQLPPLSTEVQVTGFMGKGTFILWPIIRSAGRTRCTIQHFLHVMFCILNTNQLRVQIVLQIFFFFTFWKKWMNLKALCLHQSHRHYSYVGVGILFVLFPPPHLALQLVVISCHVLRQCCLLTRLGNSTHSLN